jgi:tetratricopeptide (TPR) repeat protein
VWDAVTREPLTPPLKHPGPVSHVAFSPDGRYLACSDGLEPVGRPTGLVRVWDAATGDPVTPPLIHDDHVIWSEFTPDGRRLVTLSRDGFARLWDVAPDGRSPGEWERLAEVVSGRRFRPAGGTVPLKTDELVNLWAECRTAHPDDFRIPPAYLRSWHSLEASRCEMTEEWAAAAFHLSALVEAEPGVIEYWLRRSDARKRLGRFAEAELDLDQALHAAPGNVAARVRRAVVRRGQGKLAGSLADLDEAAKAAPTSAAVADERGHTLAELGEFDRAAAEFARSCEREPRADRMFRLGLAYLAAGDIGKYQDTCRAFWDRNNVKPYTPDTDEVCWLAAHSPAAAPVRFFHWTPSWALYAAEMKRLVEVDEAVRQAAGGGERLVTLGALLIREGKPDEAVSVLTRAVGFHERGGSATVHLLLSRAEAESGYLARARASLDAARKRYDAINRPDWELALRYRLFRAEAGAAIGRLEAREEVRALFGKLAPQKPAFVVTLKTEPTGKPYREGDEVVLTVKSERDGHLYLLRLRPDGRLECVRPAKGAPDARVAAGKPVTVRVKAGRPLGRERFLAVVTAEPLAALPAEELAKQDATAFGDGERALDRLRAVEKELGGGRAAWSVARLDVTTGGSVGIFVGINKYRSKNIPTLKACVSDARAMAEEFKKRGVAEPILLLDEDATLARIEQAFRQEVATRTRAGDTVVLYWSGMCAQKADTTGRSADGFDYYLVPHDMAHRDEPNGADPVSAARLAAWLKGLPGRRFVVVIDTDYGGGVVEGLESPDVTGLAACDRKEVCFERTDGSHGVFTYHLLDHLRRTPGPFDPAAAHKDIAGRVTAEVEKDFPGQTMHPVLIRAGEPAVGKPR